MATFKYTAVSKFGADVDGVIKAKDRDSAIIELKENVALVKSIKEVNETPEFLSTLIKPKVKEKDLALICQQFSIILAAGLPITMAIKLVADQTDDKYLKGLLINVGEDVKGGAALADAFENRDNRLPNTFTESIRAGEESGNIDITFARLATYFGNKSDIAEKVKSALIYPAFVIVLAVIVITVIMVFAVPVFTRQFMDLGIDLPFPTRALIAISNFSRKWFWVIVLVLGAIYTGYLLYRSTDAGRYKTDEWRLNVPILGKIRRMTTASEFANSFATMIASGLPVIKALSVSGRALSNYAVASDVQSSCQMVESGYKIGASLKQKTDLPELLLEVVGIGEETGSLEKSLGVVAEYYDKEAQTSTSNAIKILEPSIILILAVIVVFILLAVYLPMFSMYSAM